MAWDYLNDAKKKANVDGKRVLTIISKKISKADLDNFFYVDGKWNGKNQAEIKVTDVKTLNKLKTLFKSDIISENKSKGYFIVSNKTFKGKFLASGGIRGTGRLERVGVKTSNPSTAQQELGSIFAIAQYGKTKKMPTLKEISDSVGYVFSPEWEWNFHQHADKAAKFVGVSNIHSYDILLDSGKGKHSLLFAAARAGGMRDSKDNWNPADIWMIKKTLTEAKMKKTLDEFTSYGQVNSWMERMFKSKEIVGISLKKVNAGRAGKSDVITLSGAKFEETFTVKKVKFDPFFSNFLPEATTSSGNVFMVRTGFKSASSSVSVYLEGRMKGTSVQLGAVSAQLFVGLSEQYSKYSTRDAMKPTEKFTEKRMKELSLMVTELKRSRMFAFVEKDFYSELDALGAEDSVNSEIKLRRVFNLTLFAAVFDSSERIGNFQKMFSSAYYSSRKQNKFSSIHLKLH